MCVRVCVCVRVCMCVPESQWNQDEDYASPKRIGHELVAGLNIDRVDRFLYLGSKLSANNDINMDVEGRISSAIFHGIKHLFQPRLPTRRTKVRLFSTMVRPVLTFGADTWCLTQTIEAKILRFENNILNSGGSSIGTARLQPPSGFLGFTKIMLIYLCLTIIHMKTPIRICLY